MHLQTIQLINFKNYVDVKVDLSEKINVLVGNNGCGKTNFLDAIHYLSMTKGAFFGSDLFTIRHSEKFFSVKGLFQTGKSTTELLVVVQSGVKKIIKENGSEIQKLSDHIGRYPVVLIAPDDTGLVKEGSEARRKFFDSIISQLDHIYLENLIRYNQAMKQRNSLLKMFAESGTVDPIVLDSYDAVLVETGKYLFRRRENFIEEFIPAFTRFYTYIVANESVTLSYESEVKNVSLAEGLQRNRQRDLHLQRTNFGLHRDDYQFTLSGGDLKRLGSQGQQKSFIIALKLAQFEILKTRKSVKPILLLDDIFDKLDDHRIEKLLELIKNDEFGQLFITDARPGRTTAFLRKIQSPASIFEVKNGTITMQ